MYASGSLQFMVLVQLGPSSWLAYYCVYLLALCGISSVNQGLLSPFFAFISLGGLPPLAMFRAKAFAIAVLPTLYACLVLILSVVTF